MENLPWQPGDDLRLLIDQVLAQEREPRLEKLRKEQQSLIARQTAAGSLRSGGTIHLQAELMKATLTEYIGAGVSAVMDTLDNVYDGSAPVEALPWLRERLRREIDGLLGSMRASLIQDVQRFRLPLEEQHVSHMFVGAEIEPTRLVEISLGRRQVRHDLARLTPPRTAVGPALADAFISHASEDKDDVAIPIAQRLEQLGFAVWLDRAQLKLGDRLLDKIDEGLAACRYGVTILSPHFFAKRWPRAELAGLAARQDAEERKIILPVWHNIRQSEVAKYSPILAAVLGVSTEAGLDKVVEAIVEVLRQQ